MVLQVGSTYTIRLDGSTATQGYNQLEDFINFPNNLFHVQSVTSYYSADSSTFVGNSSDKLYADACLWDLNPSSPTYRSCLGGDGKVGGTLHTNYNIIILSGAGTTQKINTLIYDFSGSSYHYNSDFSGNEVFAMIASPLTMTKSFSPVSVNAASTTDLSIVIHNTGSTAISGVSVSDTLPSGLTLSSSTSSLCSGTLTTTSPNLISLSGATIPGSGNCTISVTVTAGSTGTYTNTTGHLFINGADTGITATANLTVAAPQTGSGFCATAVTLAHWTVPSTSTNPPDKTGGLPTTQSGNVSTATVISHTADAAIKTNSGQNDTYSWSTYGYKTNGNYIEFTLDTSHFSNLTMSFYVNNPGSGNGPTVITLAVDNTGTGTGYAAPVLTIASPATGFTKYSHTFSADQTNASGNTRFKLTATGANTDNSSSGLLYDNILFEGDQTTGCLTATVPTLTKSFLTSPIALNAASTLRFTMANPNATRLTGVTFTDTLPVGLTVASGSSTICSGTLTSANPTSISFSGGIIPASSSCNVDVSVTGAVAGAYTNTSGFISSTESGTNSTSSGFGTANLTVLSLPQISKSFSPQVILAGTNSTLSFTITNPNSTGLTGLAFTDNLPTSPGTMLVVTPIISSACGGTLTTSNAPSKIILAGGSLAANASCTFSLSVTAATVTSTTPYTNTVSVTSAEAGTSASASAELAVRSNQSAIAIYKEISTSPAGPWAKIALVAVGTPVYYRLTIENTGDVPLSPVWVTDTKVGTSSCILPSVLPVASASTDPTASCVLGPVTAQEGGDTNTATAHGRFNLVQIDSTTNSASYAIASLSLAKSVTQTTFSAVGEPLNYS